MLGLAWPPPVIAAVPADNTDLTQLLRANAQLDALRDYADDAAMLRVKLQQLALINEKGFG